MLPPPLSGFPSVLMRGSRGGQRNAYTPGQPATSSSPVASTGSAGTGKPLDYQERCSLPGGVQPRVDSAQTSVDNVQPRSHRRTRCPPLLSTLVLASTSFLLFCDINFPLTWFCSEPLAELKIPGRVDIGHGFLFMLDSGFFLFFFYLNHGRTRKPTNA